LDRFERVETIGFRYGQRHSVEMEVREDVRQAIAGQRREWAFRLSADRVVDASVIGQIGESELTGASADYFAASGLPPTFVPGRNLMFLTLSAAHAYRRDIKHIVTGVCETDYSGYPDCRDDTIKALQAALNLGMESRFVLHTPLMWIDKADTWNLAEQLGGRQLVETIRSKTHTCYNGTRDALHSWGYGCNQCAACDLRRRGWLAYEGLEEGAIA
jgi:7-cyano-7-deazaguanine synthase